MPTTLSDLSRAVRPTLFATARNPELLSALTLAHLASGSLHRLAARALPEPPANPLEGLERLRRFLDRRFRHLAFEEHARIWGFFEEERLRDPEDRERAETTRLLLEEAYDATQGTSRPIPEIYRTFLENRCFPEVLYPPLDVILRLDAGTRTLGPTTCCDEALLFGALAVATGLCAPEDLTFLGSPFHYTLFVPSSGGTYWFNGKKEGLDRETWRAMGSGEEARKQLRTRLPVADRVITLRGAAVRGRPGSLSSGNLERAAERIRDFLGFEPTLLEELRSSDPTPPEPSPPCWKEAPQDAAGWEEALRRGEGPIPLLARHAHRSLRGTHLRAFEEAALRGNAPFLRGAQVLSLDDAVQALRELPDPTSPLEGTDRLALPDEVFRLGRGTPRERALALFALLRHSPLAADGIHLPREEREPAALSLCVGGPDWGVLWGNVHIPGEDLLPR